jgi:uncharacterized repeat protein (TIGR04076 family)
MSICRHALADSQRIYYFVPSHEYISYSAEMEIIMKLIIKVVDIRGKCPVYEIGKKITLMEGYILDPFESDSACMHSLASILPYYVALAKGVKARELGLARGESEEAYVQCLDPCEITGGGTVRFEISRVPSK